MQKKSQDNLSLFALVMMAIISVDSLRNIPIAAQYGLSVIGFYLIAGIFFFLPLTWVTSQLATAYPKTGGAYIWIKTAFGSGWGHAAIGIQWLYNMIWYPTIFAFIVATLGSLFSPTLEHSKSFILVTSLVFFALLSVLHCRSLRMSSWISIASAILGTLVPMGLIIAIACYWLLMGHPSATPLTWAGLLPTPHAIKNIGFFANILFSLLGIEVVAIHAGNVSLPDQNYPRALGISAVLILFSLVLSSVGLCMLMPSTQIGLMTGLMDTLEQFFAVYPIPGITIWIGLAIIIGGLGIASSWMLSLARGLHVALCVMNAPLWLQKLNKNQMPSRILLLQTLIFALLLSTFVLFDNMNAAYWTLSAITAQLALVYYILLFCAAMKLLKHTSQIKSTIWRIFLPSCACLTCVVGIIAGFVPLTA